MYRYCMYAYPKHWYYTVYMTQYYVSRYVCILWHTMYRYCMYAYPKHWYYTVYMTQYYVSVLYVCIPQTLILYSIHDTVLYWYCMYAYPKHYVSVLYVCIPQTLILYSIHDTVLCIGTVCMHTPNTDIIQYTWHSTMYTVCMHTPNTDIIQYTWHSTMYRYCMYAYPKHWYYTVYMTQYYVSVLYACIPQTLILFKYTPSREDLEQTIWRGELWARKAHSGLWRTPKLEKEMLYYFWEQILADWVLFITCNNLQQNILLLLCVHYSHRRYVVIVFSKIWNQLLTNFQIFRWFGMEWPYFKTTL